MCCNAFNPHVRNAINPNNEQLDYEDELFMI